MMLAIIYLIFTNISTFIILTFIIYLMTKKLKEREYKIKELEEGFHQENFNDLLSTNILEDISSYTAEDLKNKTNSEIEEYLEIEKGNK